MVTCKINRQIMLSDINVRKKEARAYMCKFDVRQRPVFVVNGDALHGIECGVLSIYYFAKDGVF
jgi:hypothetical protein